MSRTVDVAAVRAFVAAAGLLFLLIFLVHAARIVAEGPGPLSQPIFLLTSIVSLGIATWSLILLRRRR